ncbi:efflux transporter outer membrane subunit [Parabacteroides distasonis]|uniref:efflux transporter outer membrane subunit n=1 Tax=Parabacteroides TaxID=375288 RepID=UPI00189BCB48|nr:MULTISPECIES: efflux transporter outer membrane subunit [Parabacteroides]MDB8998392.1 efflux transporter outer membrane subunit [Parabacteroides distasonis]MDB9073355.1 efflux transporter outer membrane subunit [Parabacteroides distasonis]
MKQHIIITLAVSSVMLSSCGIYSKYKPATEVPENLYGQETVVTEDTVTLGSMNWREVFTDPQLQTLIEQGLQNNTDYLSAQLRVEEAEATLLSAKLAFLPSFAFSPQGTVSSFDSHKATQTYSVPITASWELDIFGKMRNAKKQAQALYAQSQDYRQAVRTQLIAGIANTYYTLLMLDAQLEISEQTASSWKETVNSTRALMNAGMADEAAVSQMEATYYSICTSVLDLKEQLNQVENSLALLLAETPHIIQRGKLEGQQLPEDFSVGIPVHLLSNRPDVRVAERTLESAFYATNQARSAFYPSITLSGSAGWTNSAGAAITNPGKFLASAVGSLTQPLFARGQLLGQLKITKAQQEEARLSFEQALLNAGTEVNDALVQYHTARDKAVYFEKQIESLERAYKSTSLLMRHGTTTYLEVLTAQQGLLNAQLTQVANRFTEIQGVINLYQALGGGRE